MSDQLAYIFPGQGAQVVGMGRDFAEAYPVAKETFEEADDLLERSLSRVIFDGPQAQLTRTDQSQLAIFVTSAAILRVMRKIAPEITPAVAAGLSLGEYTALLQAEALDFRTCLQLVDKRGRYMSEACDAAAGTMAVIVGMGCDEVERLVNELNLPDDLWAANYNCPGQVVISGTLKGIATAKEEAAKRGAKRILPLDVHGAFHSGLMSSAKEKLAPCIREADFGMLKTALVMNVPGDFVCDIDLVKENLIDQVTRPVRWERGIRKMEEKGVTTFVEIGPGKTLTGMNKRIGIKGRTISLSQVDDIRLWEQEVAAWSKC